MSETIAARLGRELGGEWEYRGFAGWDCADGERGVRAVAHGCITAYGEYEESRPPSWELRQPGKDPVDVTHIVDPSGIFNRKESPDA